MQRKRKVQHIGPTWLRLPLSILIGLSLCWLYWQTLTTCVELAIKAQWPL